MAITTSTKDKLALKQLKNDIKTMNKLIEDYQSTQDEELKAEIFGTVWMKYRDKIRYEVIKREYNQAEHDDMVSHCITYLKRALETFDLSKGVVFWTHLYWKVRQGISDYQRYHALISGKVRPDIDSLNVKAQDEEKEILDLMPGESETHVEYNIIDSVNGSATAKQHFAARAVFDSIRFDYPIERYCKAQGMSRQAFEFRWKGFKRKAVELLKNDIELVRL